MIKAQTQLLFPVTIYFPLVLCMVWYDNKFETKNEIYF